MTNSFLLAPDVAEVFSNAEAVNEALRVLINIANAKIKGQHNSEQGRSLAC